MALASCGTENDDVQIQPADTDKTVENTIADTKEQITFKAVYSNGDGLSKTAIEDRKKLVFTAGDQIKVFDGTEASVFDGDIADGASATCNFTGTANPDAETYYAVYPKSAEKLTASSASATIPDAQDAVAGTFDKNAHVMVASASGTNKEFKFKTANAFIRFTAPRNLESVVMTGNNGEKIAGNITVSDYSDIAVSDASATSITLSGTMEKGKEYYISYAPADFTKGITLTLTDEDGNEGTYTTNRFESKPNQVNNIKEEKLEKAFYYKLPAGESLSDYLANFTGEVAEVILTNYSSDDVIIALDFNPTKKVKLVLPGSVESIGDYEFRERNNLVSIEMPGVTSIGKYAFYHCSNLVLTSLPDGVTSIGDYAFSTCTNLALTSLPEKVKSIGGYAFFGCKNLAPTSLPEDLESIGDCAFFNCTNLALKSLPEKLTTIGKRAFVNCTSLALTSIPNKVSSIGDNAFLGCTSLALESLSDGVTSIGDNTFYGCTNLALKSLPDGVTSIGSNAFDGCTSLALTSLPENLTSIGIKAFNGCTNLKLKSLPKNLTSIVDRAFFNCTSLALESLPEDLESIGDAAFYGCASLAITSLPKNLTSIGDNAFVDCESLVQITIPSNVTTLGNDAFKGCSNLKSITILGNPKIGDIAQEDDYFQRPNGTVINVSEASYNRYTNYWDYWNTRSYITVNVLP